MEEPRVALVVPPLRERTYPGKFMGIDYLASSLIESGCEVRVVDVDVMGYEYLRSQMAELTPHLVGITNMSIQNDEANRLARSIKQEFPGCVVVKGGVHETFASRFTLDLHHEYIDACVLGEGEETVCELASAAARGVFEAERGDISGVAYWDGKTVVTTGYRGQVDVNRHLPARLQFDETYNFDVFGDCKTAQVMASRGCRHNCRFCAEAAGLHRQTVRLRHIASIERELDIICEEGYEAVYFDDSTFTHDRDWAIDVGEACKQRHLKWGCNTRVECLDERLVHAIADQGCVYLFCGVESAVPDVLRGMGKTGSPEAYVERARSAYSWLREVGIATSVFLLFGSARAKRKRDGNGYEPDTLEDAKASIDFVVNDIDADYVSMNVLRLLPGTIFSFALPYGCVRPTGREPVHGGYYDEAWYTTHGVEDIRARHMIYRAFEGCGSINPPHMTPKRCCEILRYAVESVNRKNTVHTGPPTRIVVDPRFERFLHSTSDRGHVSYTLASFEEIDRASPEAPSPE